MKITKELDIDNLKVFTDSQLIIGQVKDEFEARDPVMMKYLQKVKHLISTLKYFEISHISRIKNAPVDELFRFVTTSFNSLGRTFVKCLEQPSIDKVKEVLQVNYKPN